MAAMFYSLQAGGMIVNYSKMASLLLPKDEQALRIRRWHGFWTPERIA